MDEVTGQDGKVGVPDLPVTVIGGYLGAGKTTLVNHLLRTAGERLAVLVNDFGEIDIDADLIESDDGETISLANGCICCSLVDGFAAALDTVRSIEPRPDRLVIETSGVADPATVAAYGHGPGLALDAVVVVVDAETIRQRATDRYVGETVVGQLGSADVVVVNKVDLVDEREAASVVAWVSERADGAVVVAVTDSQVDPVVLFGREPSRAHLRDTTAAAPHQQADDDYESWSWSSDGGVQRDRVEALMDALPETVVRAKGLLWIDDGSATGDSTTSCEPCVDGGGSRAERREVLQRVGRRWSLRPATTDLDGTGSRLVVIGLRGAIDDGWLAAQLDPAS